MSLPANNNLPAEKQKKNYSPSALNVYLLFRREEETTKNEKTRRRDRIFHHSTSTDIIGSPAAERSREWDLGFEGETRK